MKIETKEILDILKPFRNGCNFKLVKAGSGLHLIEGCYNLKRLATGPHKYLNEIHAQTGKKIGKIDQIYLVDNVRKVKSAILNAGYSCNICDQLEGH